MPGSRPSHHVQATANILIDRLHLAPGGRRVFENFSLTIRSGKITAFLGRSGVGKSTLLRAIAGLDDAGAGSIIYDTGIHDTGIHDTGIHDTGTPVEGTVALMAQQALLMPWLNLTGNVCLGATLRREQPDFARAAMILGEVGLRGRESTYPDTLSGGMRQRVALARTLMEDRPVVCMDEPFSAIDAVTRMDLHALTVRLLAERTVVLVTHDPLEALVLADRIVVLGGTPVKTMLDIDLSANRYAAAPRDLADGALAPLHATLLSSLREAGA